MIEILEIIKSKTYSNDSIENEIVAVMENEGWIVIKQYPVPNRGDGRRGRIDIFTIKTNGLKSKIICIEIDWKIPRNKSIFKLNSLHKDIHKVIILRHPWNKPNPPGIDEVFSVKVR